MNDKRYNVMLSYDTMAHNADDALLVGLSAFGDRNGGLVEVFEDGNDNLVLEGELGALAEKKTTPGVVATSPDASNENTKHAIVISYSTHAADAKDALEAALSVIDDRSGGYVEVFEGTEEGAILEGEVAAVVLEPVTSINLSLIFHPADGAITAASSARLKAAFNTYFGEHGIPDNVEGIADEAYRELATTYGEEFGEACEQFEQYGAFKV